MAYRLSARSLKNLVGVHPDLQKVVKKAIELTTVDFVVIEGVRTREQCMINFGKGRTAAECLAASVPARYAQPKTDKVTKLKDPFASKHVVGHAVDIAPFPVDWTDTSKFDAIAKAMFAAAKSLKVKLRWGADWDADGKPRERGETDSPHFEI